LENAIGAITKLKSREKFDDLTSYISNVKKLMEKEHNNSEDVKITKVSSPQQIQQKDSPIITSKPKEELRSESANFSFYLNYIFKKLRSGKWMIFSSLILLVAVYLYFNRKNVSSIISKILGYTNNNEISNIQPKPLIQRRERN